MPRRPCRQKASCKERRDGEGRVVADLVVYYFFTIGEWSGLLSGVAHAMQAMQAEGQLRGWRKARRGGGGKLAFMECV